MKAIQWHPVGSLTLGGTVCSRSWGREAASALLPLLILGSIATEALAGPGVLTDAEMDTITAADSGQQHWLVAGDSSTVAVTGAAFGARATAPHGIPTPVGVSVDTAGVRDAATAVARGTKAAASDLRAAAGQAISTPPASAKVDTAGVRDAATAVARGTKAAASDLRAAAERGIRVPADLGTGTARVSESATSVIRSNGTVAKATTKVSASETGRVITRAFTTVSVNN